MCDGIERCRRFVLRAIEFIKSHVDLYIEVEIYILEAYSVYE